MLPSVRRQHPQIDLGHPRETVRLGLAFGAGLASVRDEQDAQAFFRSARALATASIRSQSVRLALNPPQELSQRFWLFSDRRPALHSGDESEDPIFF